jgi:hypothetical protein
MIHQTPVLRGIIRGNTIELEQEPGLPDGQEVRVTVQPILPPGEGIKQSAGTWADAGDELENWLEEMRSSRQYDRPGLPE